jgi:hypothetical protein
MALTLKTLAKPIGKRIQVFSEGHPSVATFAGVIGNLSNRFSKAVAVQYAGSARFEVKELPHKVAVKRGSKFLGEAFIVAVASAIVVYEVQKSEKKDEVKALNAAQSIVDLANREEEQFLALETQLKQLAEQNVALNETLNRHTARTALQRAA